MSDPVSETVKCSMVNCNRTESAVGPELNDCGRALYRAGWRKYKQYQICPACITKHSPDAGNVYGPKLLGALKAVEGMMRVKS
jgi:hypothetical protein